MFRNEIYKLFVKQKIGIFVAALIVLRIVTVFIAGYDSHYMIDENEKYYQEYLQKYEGKITEDTRKKIEREYERLSASDQELLASEQRNKAFQIIYDQYDYQKENGSGYILETRGWQSILEHDEIDFCLLICLIIVITALWGNEYETEMDSMLRSCKKGKYRAPAAKVIVGVIFSAIASLLFQLIQVTYLIGTVGLKHSDYPLQSLEYFQNTQYRLSLGAAAAIMVIIKLTGAILMALLVMLMNIGIKRKTASMIMSMAMMLLAEIIFRGGTAIYYMPFPLGPLKGAGYLWPAQFEYKYAGEELVKVCTFHEIPVGNFVTLLVVYIAESVILGGVCVFFFSGGKIGRRTPHKKYLKTTACFIICCLFVTGCSRSRQDISVSIGQDDTQSQAEWNGSTLEIDYEDNTILLTGRDGKREPLVRNVFPSKLVIQKIFVYENDCYYLSENDESSGICVRKIDLTNYDDTLIYDSADENIEDFFGILRKEEKYDERFDNIEETKWFFVADDCIYWKKKYYVEQVNIKNGQKKIIAENVADDDIAYVNGNFRYIDAEGKQGTLVLE